MTVVVPYMATEALCNMTLPCALDIANKGFREAMRFDEVLAKGPNVYDGRVANKFVAESLGLKYTPFS
jgi:alanine dehydrogenase